MTTNCPNCGAPIDRSRDSCEYCGTPYEKSNDIRIEVTAPDPNIDDFIESLRRMSKCGGFNLYDSSTLYADDQVVYKLDGTAWQPTPEEERKMIEDMRNVAPMIFPKIEPKVECVINLIDQFKYERKKELLHDILGVLILLGPAIIASVITWFSIH